MVIERWPWVGALLDLAFPRSCVITGEALSGRDRGYYLSERGMAHLQLAVPPCCPVCGVPFAGELVETRVCPHCQDLEPAFERGRTLFVLGEAGRVLVHTFKYEGGRWLLPDIARVAERVPGFLEALKGAMLVPVPLFPKRQHERGFNQSRLLAEVFAKTAGAQVAEVLRRTRETASQTRLSRAERFKNMRGAFAVKEGVELYPWERYVLVDDVFTTGATLNACAQALKAAGAEKIDIATLAHG